MAWPVNQMELAFHLNRKPEAPQRGAAVSKPVDRSRTDQFHIISSTLLARLARNLQKYLQLHCWCLVYPFDIWISHAPQGFTLASSKNILWDLLGHDCFKNIHSPWRRSQTCLCVVSNQWKMHHSCWLLFTLFLVRGRTAMTKAENHVYFISSILFFSEDAAQSKSPKPRWTKGARLASFEKNKPVDKSRC